MCLRFDFDDMSYKSSSVHIYNPDIEPSIGNHNEAFLKGYYDLLDSFLSEVMKYTADYCKERINVFEAQQEIATKSLSENNLGEVFTEIKKTLMTNQAKRKKTLKEVKEWKFIRLKYYSKSSETRQRREQDINTNNDRPSYALVVRIQPSKQVISRKNNDRNLNQVRLSKRNSRVNLHRDQTDQSNQRETQINDLQWQLNTMRQTQQEQQGLCRNTGKFSSSAKKRGARLHLVGGKQKQQGSHQHKRSSRVHINRYGNFKRIRETIKNTSKYKSDPFGIVVNLSVLEFSIPVYKLLGKNLNFCPTPTILDKNSMNKELDSFFRCIKLWARFGNDTRKQTAITEEDTFKPCSAWEPNHTHHKVDTFCDAV